MPCPERAQRLRRPASPNAPPYGCGIAGRRTVRGARRSKMIDDRASHAALAGLEDAHAMTTTPVNPYAAALGDSEPLDALGRTPARIASLVGSWSDADFERSYAPGKWSARLILIHLAQSELAFGARMRYALGERDYVAQSFSQDDWLPADQGTGARLALDTYLALRRFNLAMWRSLAPDARDRPFRHPELGTISVAWVMAQMAGHERHHLAQLESLA
jgi:hypothetical protein